MRGVFGRTLSPPYCTVLLTSPIALSVRASVRPSVPIFSRGSCDASQVDVLSLFLAGNLTATVLLPPVLATLLPHRYLRASLTEASLLLGFLFGACGLSAYGIGQSGGTYDEGLRLAWMDNEYRYDYFLVALGASTGGVLLGVFVGFLVRARRSRRHRAACNSASKDDCDAGVKQEEPPSFMDEFWGGNASTLGLESCCLISQEVEVGLPTGGIVQSGD